VENGIRLDIAGGINSMASPDQIAENGGGWPFLQNVRRYRKSMTVARFPLGVNLLTSALANGITSVARLNDPYQSPTPYAYLSVSNGSLYVGSTQVASGLSGNPLSFLPYRPPASPRPFDYIADTSLAVSILNPSYAAYGIVSGMLKVRADGTVYKMGVKEPQVAPAITVGSGTGPNWVTYRYTYRDKNTGATSNPSPESAPQIVPQSNSTGTIIPHSSDQGVSMSWNASQYEVQVDGQLRTKGGVAGGTLTNYINAFDYGLTIPAGVTIDGVEVDLNWAGQAVATGTIQNVALFYQGAILGQPKTPGAQNQVTPTADLILGGGSDSWGAIITPAIANDPTFGFGVQVLVTDTGTTRSFFYSFTITVYYTSLSGTGTCTASLDPQVNTIDVYRQGPGLDNFTYVLSVPNSSPSFTDTATDLSIASNPLMSFNNYEPFPSIDLPRSGTCNVAANGAIAWVSGDVFNVRWLPGTIVLIAGVAYVLYNRPSSTTAMEVYTTVASTDGTGFISFGYPPTGTGQTWQINEPDLAAEPSPVLWGPTPDSGGGSFMLGLDPLNPGDLLTSMGNNFDSAPSSQRLYVCSPSEGLVNGIVTSELHVVFSPERFWLLYPNFSDAVATVTGTTGPLWTPVQAASTRGLFMRYALGGIGSLIAFRAKDGIFVSQGGGPEQDVSANIYNLFPHGEPEGPSPIVIGNQTIYPPNDSLPNAQTIACVPGYIFYDYQDTTGTPRTLVYDMEAKGWVVDSYTPSVNCHALATGVNQILCGCSDGTIRAFDAAGTETQTAVIITRSEGKGSTRIVKRVGGVFLRAVAASVISMAFWANRLQTAITGFLPATVGTGAAESDYLVDFTAATNADVKDLACQFSWPIVSGNVLSEWQPDWTIMPAAMIGWKTGLLSYGPGWGHVEWINLAYQSTATVTLVMTPDNGSPITLTFPSTSGAQVKLFSTFPPNKFKIIGWTANSSQPFTIYAAGCAVMYSGWGVKSVTIKPFEAGFGVGDSTT
jgi:hypothetical protein